MNHHIRHHPFSTDTAEKHMLRHVCTAHRSDTVEAFLKKLRACTAPVEALDSVFVVDDKGVIAGMVPMQKLLKSDTGNRMSEIMRPHPIAIRPGTDRESAARLAIHHEVDEVPVTDDEGHILGVIPTRSFLKILHEEHIEDFLRSAGFRREHGGTFTDVLHAKVSALIRARTPWLLIGLLGGMGAAFITSSFEETLREDLALAFFIPALLYMADAIGTQTEALYLRLYDMGTFKLRSYLLRELKVAVGVGAIASMLIFFYAALVFRSFEVARVVGVSMFITNVIAVVVATLIPALLTHFKKDPAIGSGPFATVVQDIITIATYFAAAKLLL